MIIDALLIGLVIYRPSIGLLAWVAVLVIIRHTPALADQVALMLDLESYDEWSAYIARLALPGWRSPDRLMSRSYVPPPENDAPPVHVPVPGTAVVPGKTMSDRDIIMDQWIVALAEAKDEKGEELFTGNDIFKAVGGHRATVQKRIKEIRTGIPQAQFRQEDQTTAPASYPVTKQ